MLSASPVFLAWLSTPSCPCTLQLYPKDAFLSTVVMPTYKFTHCLSCPPKEVETRRDWRIHLMAQGVQVASARLMAVCPHGVAGQQGCGCDPGYPVSFQPSPLASLHVPLPDGVPLTSPPLVGGLGGDCYGLQLQIPLPNWLLLGSSSRKWQQGSAGGRRASLGVSAWFTSLQGFP